MNNTASGKPPFPKIGKSAKEGHAESKSQSKQTCSKDNKPTVASTSAYGQRQRGLSDSSCEVRLDPRAAVCSKPERQSRGEDFLSRQISGERYLTPSSRRNTAISQAEKQQIPLHRQPFGTLTGAPITLNLSSSYGLKPPGTDGKPISEAQLLELSSATCTATESEPSMAAGRNKPLSFEELSALSESFSQDHHSAHEAFPIPPPTPLTALFREREIALHVPGHDEAEDQFFSPNSSDSEDLKTTDSEHELTANVTINENDLCSHKETNDYVNLEETLLTSESLAAALEMATAEADKIRNARKTNVRLMEQLQLKGEEIRKAYEELDKESEELERKGNEALVMREELNMKDREISARIEKLNFLMSGFESGRAEEDCNNTTLFVNHEIKAKSRTGREAAVRLEGTVKKGVFRPADARCVKGSRMEHGLPLTSDISQKASLTDGREDSSVSYDDDCERKMENASCDEAAHSTKKGRSVARQPKVPAKGAMFYPATLEKDFECGLCGSIAVDLDHTRRHMKLIHKKDVRQIWLYCSEPTAAGGICAQPFYNIGKYHQHMEKDHKPT